jgi:uncharacterized protein
MKINLRNHMKKFTYGLVFSAFSLAGVQAVAGVYDDFFAAIKRNNANTMQTVLARGFDVNTPGPNGENGLSMALFEESDKVVQVLMAWPKTDVNALNRRGESPLMLASLRGQEDVAKSLMKKGADVNKTGWTPLHYAASAGKLALMTLLIENHAYIDAESPNGTTPLMMAAMYGTGAAVDLLLQEGADPQLKNQQGLTALQFAERGERPDAIKSLSNPTLKQRAKPPG